MALPHLVNGLDGAVVSGNMRSMRTVARIACVLAGGALAFGQYKSEPAGAPPTEAAPAIHDALQKDGVRITGPKGTVCEIWLRATAPSGPKSSESDVTLPTIPQGALLGVIRFPDKGSDRRGTTVKPGVYTLRYSNYPINGDHQGVAPQRDFVLLSLAATDTDLNATPNFDQLVNMSRKASGAQHPLVLSIWNPDTDFKAGFDKQGDTDWVLQEKLGDTPFAIILVGTAGS
jgi:hypothetical protein